MRLPDRHLRIDFKMQVDVVSKTSSPRKTFLDAERPRHSQGYFANFFQFGGFGDSVEQRLDGSLDDAHRQRNDDEADYNPPEMVRAPEAGWIVKREEHRHHGN